MILRDSFVFLLCCLTIGGYCHIVIVNENGPAMSIGTRSNKTKTSNSSHPLFTIGDPKSIKQAKGRARVKSQLPQITLKSSSKSRQLSKSGTNLTTRYREAALKNGPKLNCSFYGQYDYGLPPTLKRVAVASFPKLERLADTFSYLLECTRQELDSFSEQFLNQGTSAFLYCAYWLTYEDPTSWPSSMSKLKSIFHGHVRSLSTDKRKVLQQFRTASRKLIYHLKNNQGLCISQIENKEAIGLWFFDAHDNSLHEGCDLERKLFVCKTSNCNSRDNTLRICPDATTYSVTTRSSTRSTTSSPVVTTTTRATTTTLRTMTTTMAEVVQEEPDDRLDSFGGRPTVPHYRREKIREFGRTMGKEQTEPLPTTTNNMATPTEDIAPPPYKSNPITTIRVTFGKVTNKLESSPTTTSASLQTKSTIQPNSVSPSMTLAPTQPLWPLKQTSTNLPTFILEGDDRTDSSSSSGDDVRTRTKPTAESRLSLTSTDRVSMTKGTELLLNRSTDSPIDSTSVPVATRTSSSSRSTNVTTSTTAAKEPANIQSKSTMKFEPLIDKVKKVQKVHNLKNDPHFTRDNEDDTEATAAAASSIIKWVLLALHVLCFINFTYS